MTRGTVDRAVRDTICLYCILFLTIRYIVTVHCLLISLFPNITCSSICCCCVQFLQGLSLLYAVSCSSIYRYCILFHVVRYIVTVHCLLISLFPNITRSSICRSCVQFLQGLSLLFAVSCSSIYRYCIRFHVVRYIVTVHCFTQLDISLPSTIRFLRIRFWFHSQPFVTGFAPYKLDKKISRLISSNLTSVDRKWKSELENIWEEPVVANFKVLLVFGRTEKNSEKVWCRHLLFIEIQDLSQYVTQM
jgi:hypothetical protein